MTSFLKQFKIQSEISTPILKVLIISEFIYNIRKSTNPLRIYKLQIEIGYLEISCIVMEIRNWFLVNIKNTITIFKFLFSITNFQFPNN